MRILLFFVIATLSSYFFRLDFFKIRPDLKISFTIENAFFAIFLEGFGIFVAAVLAIYLLKLKRKTTISFFGTSRTKSILICILPLTLVCLIGIQNTSDLNAHWYGFIAITSTLVYCIMEEYGWRGYLQEELKSLKPWYQYVIIGFMWHVWHLNFIRDTGVLNNLIFLVAMIAASWGIDQVATATKSILACASYHLLFQIMVYNSLIKDGLNEKQKLIILGVSFVLMFIVIKKWEKAQIIKN